MNVLEYTQKLKVQISFPCGWKAKNVIWNRFNLCFIVATFDSPPGVIALLKQAGTDLMFSLVMTNLIPGVKISEFF